MDIDAASSRIRLLEVDPDLARFLSNDELSDAGRLALSVLTVGREKDSLEDRLRDHRAFAAVLVDGMVLQQVQIGDQVGMHLLGPGDVVSVSGGPPSMLVGEFSARPIPGTRLALLGGEFLLAARRWPGLFRGLHLRTVQQTERLATQLVVCQLPRVDQRLLALMWLLAESWGRVTPTGTTLPLKLTHDALGALIGARRPTVTLALRDLTERGAVVRQDEGWLLLEAPPGASRPVEAFRSPSLIDEQPSRWIAAGAVPPDRELDPVTLTLLKERLNGLRARYETDRQSFDERMRAFTATRERCRASRTRVSEDRRGRSRAPSS